MVVCMHSIIKYEEIYAHMHACRSVW